MSIRALHVVVVAYHAADALDRTLAALDSTLPVTVVDNSQSDAVRSVSRKWGAEYVETANNTGFAAGVNTALRVILRGSPQDVLLLNPDETISAGEIAELATALHASERVGAVAPRLVDEEGKPQRVLWPFPSPGHAWREAVGLARLQTGARFAVGAVLLLRWEALREVGLFDERFFLYAEEADWQRRALGLGWHAAMHPAITAVHGGAGTSPDPIRREMLFHAAQETYVRKWHGVPGWWVYRAAVVVGAALRVALLRDERREGAGRRLHLYVRGPCRAIAAPGL